MIQESNKNRGTRVRGVSKYMVREPAIQSLQKVGVFDALILFKLYKYRTLR